jgi:hypothetical protein
MGARRILDVLSRRSVRTAGFSVAVIVGVAAVCPHPLVAQSSEEASGPVKVGDRWVYEIRDESTGYPKGGYTDMITEVSPREIILNRTFREPVYGSPESVLITFDRDWDAVDNLLWKFEPNNAQGIRLPLTLGKTWQAEFDAKNLDTGAIYRGTSSSKVVGREPTTTSAGTFDTFKIEHKSNLISPSDASKIWENEVVVWYAPQINHWARQTILVVFEKRTRLNVSEELADYTRKF